MEWAGAIVPLRDVAMPSTIWQNLAALPAVSAPFGTDDDGLPVGIQVTGRWGEEGVVLDVAEARQRHSEAELPVDPGGRQRRD